MFTFRRRPGPSRVRRRVALRLDTFEERTLPAVAVGVNVNSTQSDQTPPVGNSGAVGPNHYVQLATGQFTVFDKAGAVVNQVTETAFWLNAGITQTVVDQLLSQSRVVYDPLSDRWFAVEVTLANTNNQVLIARSNTNDPAATPGNWTALNYTATAGQYGSFPTLAVDKNGVYVGTGNFTTSASGGQAVGSTMTSIPKADLLLATPTVANRTQVTQTYDPIFNPAVPMGWSPQAVTNFDPADNTASVVATHYTDFDLISYWEISGSGAPNATFGSTTNLGIPHNALPGLTRQPDGTRNISGGNDDRYTGAAFQVGDLIYAVHPISVNSSGVGTTTGSNTTNAVQLIVIRDSTNTVVTTKTFFNPAYDYTYPSVSANAFGDIVIGFNRSGLDASTGNLGAYAIYARINPATPGAGVTELGTVALQAGLFNAYLLTGVPTTAGEPWGPHTATSVDPSDPFAFWTTVQYAKSNAAGESMWATKVSQVLVSPRALTVSSPTANGTYSNGDTIDITIAFNGPVTVTGAPQLALNSGGTANYFSGSGTSTLTFRYTVGASDSAGDLDYTAAGINLNGGTIAHTASGFSVAAELTLPAPGATGSLAANKNLVVQATQAAAAVTGVSSTAANGAYAAGAAIPVTVTFTRAVLVTGTPRLALNTGANATYTSGSGSTTLVFTYTVAAGQNTADLDYTSATALTLNGGTINDEGNGTAATLTLAAPGATGSLGFNKNIVIDTQPPVVSGVSSTATNGAYAAGAAIPVTVTFSEPVAVSTAGGTPRIALNSGGTAAYTGGTGTTTLTFTYTVAAGQTSADLDYTAAGINLNGGTITEASTGQAATLTLPAPAAAGSLGANKDIVIDTQPPVVTGVSSTFANGTYGAGATIPITVTFSEAVAVSTAGGTPRIALNSGGTAVYASTSGNTLTFNYTVGATDSAADLDYTAVGINLNGGTITEVSTGQNATLTLAAPAAAGSLGANKDIVIDTSRPTVVNVTSTKPNGSYGFGTVIDVTVQFDRVVNVTGSPQLALNTGVAATYLSGTGTNTLTFRYTVGSGQNSPDLDYASAGALTGGTIQDGNGQAAILTLPAPGTAGSLGANKALVIDAIGPTVLEFRVLFGSKSYDLKTSSRINLPWQVTGIRVVFSEPVSFGNLRSLTGIAATRFSGLRTRTLTWNFGGISRGILNTSLASSGLNALKDAAGNPIAAFSQAFRVLYGDFTDDGMVTAADEAGVRGAMAAPYQLLNPVGYNIFADLSGDGIVNLVDVGITRTRRGTSLP